MDAARLRDAALAWLVALIAMLVLPITALVLQNVGPAARVRVSAYLISTQSAALGAFAMLVGVLLGIETHRVLAAHRAASAARTPHRLLIWTKLGFFVLAAWVAAPQLDAFPAGGSLDARDAWARSHVPTYPALAKLVADLPELSRDLGRVRMIAPTAHYGHACAQEMNGFDMRFALDVLGDRGRGVLRIECTIDDGVILDWRSARWQFAGRTMSVPRP